MGARRLDLPDDPTAVEDVLAAFPEELEGLERSDVSPTQVSYGDGSTFVRAIDLAEVEAEGFPGTAAEYLDLLAGSGEVEVEADVTSADAGFVYLVSRTRCRTRPTRNRGRRTTRRGAPRTAAGCSPRAPDHPRSVRRSRPRSSLRWGRASAAGAPRG